MNQKLIIFFLLIAIHTISYRKDNQGYASVDPSPEKKWTVTTIAGDGRPVVANGPALNASFRDPLDVAVSDDGAIYVADVLSHSIRKIADGQVSTFAGSGISDTANGFGINASFKLPYALSLDNNGNLYTLDITDPRVRRISPDGLVSRYAGTGVEGLSGEGQNVARYSLKKI